MRVFLTVFALSAGLLLAQNPTPGNPNPNPGNPTPTPGMPVVQRFPVDLQRYLELTPQQVEQINRLNRDFAATVARKNLRSAQVRREIQEWTNAEQIVPMELGLRYAELEQIRREIRDEEARTRGAVRAVLTDAQRIKLRALEEAAKLLPLINQAAGQRLLDPPPQAILPVGGVIGAGPGPFQPQP